MAQCQILGTAHCGAHSLVLKRLTFFSQMQLGKQRCCQTLSIEPSCLPNRLLVAGETDVPIARGRSEHVTACGGVR